MSIDVTKYSSDLRNLVDDYYNHRINSDDYREERNRMLDEMDEMLNGIVHCNDQTDNESEKILNKVLGLFKKGEKEAMPE